MRTRLLPLALAGLAPAAAGQPPPATEVYLATLVLDAAPAVTGPVVNISRHDGYDNQPSFLPGGRAVLFSSNRDGRQTDIHRYDIDTGTLTQVTRTPESEYSPLVTPDGRGFSVVRVEADNTQRLWRFDLDGTNPRVVLADVRPVGYHAWIDAGRLALFVLGGQGEPATLQLADTGTGRARVIDRGIGRSLVVRPGTRHVSYVSQPAGGARTIRLLDPDTGGTSALVDALEGSQDCAWDASGRLYMARGSAIHVWQPGAAGWTPAGDLAASGIDRITRLAVSPAAAGGRTHIAIVAEPAGRGTGPRSGS